MSNEEKNVEAKQYESFVQKGLRKCTAEPLVPLGALITVGFLTMGLRAFHKGKSLQSQQLMRGRILAQGFTVIAMVIGGIGLNIPIHDRPKDMEEKMRRLNDEKLSNKIT